MYCISVSETDLDQFYILDHAVSLPVLNHVLFDIKVLTPCSIWDDRCMVTSSPMDIFDIVQASRRQLAVFPSDRSV